jgi:hypothetical protein
MVSQQAQVVALFSEDVGALTDTCDVLGPLCEGGVLLLPLHAEIPQGESFFLLAFFCASMGAVTTSFYHFNSERAYLPLFNKDVKYCYFFIKLQYFSIVLKDTGLFVME